MSRTKSLEKKQKALESAKKLFLEINYKDVSMDMVSQKAKISKNTLYNHFSNKETLFKAVLRDYWDNDYIPQLAPGDDRPIPTVLKTFAHQLMEYLYQPDTLAFFRLLIAESARFPSLAQSITEDQRAPILNQLTRYLTEQFTKANTPYSIEPATAALYFFGMLKEDSFWHVLAGFRPAYSPSEIEVHINQVITHFCDRLLA